MAKKGYVLDFSDYYLDISVPNCGGGVFSKKSEFSATFNLVFRNIVSNSRLRLKIELPIKKLFSAQIPSAREIVFSSLFTLQLPRRQCTETPWDRFPSTIMWASVPSAWFILATIDFKLIMQHTFSFDKFCKNIDVQNRKTWEQTKNNLGFKICSTR